LLKRSVKALVPLVDVIAQSPREMWEMDANKYGDGGCQVVFDTAHQIAAALPNGASGTLVTKIMLGTFGGVPAFDRYFKKGLGVSTFGPKALQKIGEFYTEHADVIEGNRVHTLEFASGRATKRRYTRAKVIDMICFAAGGM
jgi:hypothetical protein